MYPYRLVPRVLIVLSIVLDWATVAHAGTITQSSVTIRQLGTHDGVAFYFNLQEGFSAPCTYGLVYCPSSNPDCKNRYAMALVAKTTGKRLAEIRYEHNSQDNACTLYLMTVE